MGDRLNKPTMDLSRFYQAQLFKTMNLTQKNKFCSKSCLGKNKGFCECGDDVGVFYWRWSTGHSSSDIRATNDSRDILFHPCYSSGTAVVRGDELFRPNVHYFWEVMMTSKLYGTDVMVGVGTPNVDLHRCKLKFCSLLGLDSESWGYSYHGNVQHKGLTHLYGDKFGIGSIVGVHLDMCRGTLEYYLNRKPLGIAFTGLKGYDLYPMICSTAAQSSVRLVCSFSEEPSLQMLCLQLINGRRDLYEHFQTVPGLKRLYDRKYIWIVPTFLRSAKGLARLDREVFRASEERRREEEWCDSDGSSYESETASPDVSIYDIDESLGESSSTDCDADAVGRY
ncbi:unnamed protein product [Phyllotreta striolata]|uniref:B30.2/SPRY domain-containing protein n=1 Tax=Phyllotreta striolata TaxID=444603 RepID=A0A9N9TEU8_PHYSR|nr:unnamed protein product [Phyllotreta striolata]